MASAPVVQQTKSITLGWDASSTSNVRYVVSYGGKSGIYTNATPSTTLLSIVVTNLIPKSTYYFACRAFDVIGIPSDYSNEIVYTIPGKRVKLVTQETPILGGTQWTNIATNYHETDAPSGFYRVVISTDEL
jgi:hypothetical protein